MRRSIWEGVFHRRSVKTRLDLYVDLSGFADRVAPILIWTCDNSILIVHVLLQVLFRDMLKLSNSS